ncbi:flagellar basal-body rod protein FlgB [Belnapia rosea]|uniref:Flagellar basal-body rod protein FlgB n=2 Tax=Belnapia rosea TaxID=938405 RepID=A0A1G6PEJ5_9PROT|nr:flagellar basal-body rod protein FlgB [Belnapia rosea]SDC77936.1 flagellar basal-body rod protein FlgB [Belnapia rosea]
MGRLNRIFGEGAQHRRMDLTRNPTIALAERRIAWLEERQRVLAQNIANADTPGYSPRDLGDFRQSLLGAFKLARTDGQHLGGGGAARSRPDRAATDRAPNGNAVSLDREAMKIADTDTAHALATGLYRRWVGLFRTALGRSQ